MQLRVSTSCVVILGCYGVRLKSQSNPMTDAAIIILIFMFLCI